MTEQPRMAAESLRFMEIPAGMIHNKDGPEDAAVKQLGKKVGIAVVETDLTDVTKLVVP
jgi:ADP-sugar diphosphatase